VSHLRAEALLLDRRDAVATTDDDRRPVLRLVGEEPRDLLGPMSERRDLEHAERPVPEDGPDIGQRCLDGRPRLLSEVDDVPGGGELLRADGLVFRPAGDLLGDHDVGRQDDRHAGLLRRGEEPSGVVDAVVLGQALADRLALGEKERVRHAAAQDQDVDLRQEVVDDADLVRDLGPAQDRRERPPRILEETAEHLDLTFHEEPGVGRQDLGDADRGCVCAMGCPERVVDVDVGVGGELRGECRVVLLLRGMEAEVLQEDRLARAHSLHGILGAGAKRVTGDGHIATKELRQALADGPQPQAVLDLPIRASEMTGEDDLGAVGEEARDRRQGGPDPGVVGDLAVGQRNVEVDAHEDALARGVEVADRQFVHDVLIAAAAPGGTLRGWAGLTGHACRGAPVVVIRRRPRAAERPRNRSDRRRDSCSPIRCHTS